MHISHETIYRRLLIQVGGVLKKELLRHLRSRRRMWRVKHAAMQASRVGRSCMASPSVTVLPRWRSGHSRSLEEDLIISPQNTYIATPGGTAVALYDAGEGARERNGQRGNNTEPAGPTPALGLTSVVNLGSWDGIGQHKRFTVDTSVQVYFCDPQSLWQRGPNEIWTACCVSTCRKAPTCHPPRRQTWIRSRFDWTSGCGRPWNFTPRLYWTQMLRWPVKLTTVYLAKAQLLVPAHDDQYPLVLLCWARPGKRPYGSGDPGRMCAPARPMGRSDCTRNCARTVSRTGWERLKWLRKKLGLRCTQVRRFTTTTDRIIRCRCQRMCWPKRLPPGGRTKPGRPTSPMYLLRRAGCISPASKISTSVRGVGHAMKARMTTELVSRALANG